ncbi:MAG: CDP-diacylglycerol--serine O-phosphatidyltransferase [Bdellovibrio sp.]|nr:CDP-diacylglycerol--serine O-phosphatidyltransferase [Bdellovibrio sp.]
MENNLEHEKREARKLAFFLPNTFTALNMACGFISSLFSFQGDFHSACMILILGAIFDSVDGRVARLTGTQSAFGEQFDSLSDAVSFGFAPAVLIYQKFLIPLGRAGIVISFIFLLCGALRLARFNANIDRVTSHYFQGLPIPGGAMAIVGYVLLSLEFDWMNQLTFAAAIYSIFFSLLMISNIPFYSFKNATWAKEHKKAVLFFIFVILGLMFVYEYLMVSFIMWTYVAGCLLYFFTHKGELKNVFEWSNEKDAD